VEVTDLVYPFKPRRGAEELRYSLRSMENLPHDRVWIVGKELPPWARSLNLISVPDRGTKWQNIPRAIAAACEKVSERFVLANDDFFVMAPVQEMPVLHRGPLDEKKKGGSYNQGYVETAKLLRDLGVEGELLNYELHVPLPVVRDDMAEALRIAEGFKGRCLQARTLYGNLFGIGGEQMDDVKVHGSHRPAESPFLSTNEGSFGLAVGKHIRARFPEPSRYEVSDG
jgi:hypothetical protein